MTGLVSADRVVEDAMFVTANGARLWVDVSGPAVVPKDDEVQERPTLIGVHGGPGLDHVGLKDNLTPVERDVQVVYYDQRGHGRSDYGRPEQWNLQTWAGDLRALADLLGLTPPVVLGYSFGGFVGLAYAAAFPAHPAGLILTSTTGGKTDPDQTVEVFRRIGGEEAAATAARDFAEMSEASSAGFDRVCYPLFSARPGFEEEAAKSLKRSIHTTDVNLHYWRNEHPHQDTWELLERVTCPVLIIAGEDDPMCPLSMVKDLAAGLTNADVDLVVVKGARHTVFRDDPETTARAVTDFVRSCTRT